MNEASRYLLLFTACILMASHLLALNYGYRGQLSGWGNMSENDESWRKAGGIRYIPEFKTETLLRNNLHLEAEISLNCYFSSASGTKPDALGELYRPEFRYALGGRWDWKIGWLLESVLQVHESDQVEYPCSKMAVIGLVGPNGSGKTTRLNIIGTLDNPTTLSPALSNAVSEGKGTPILIVSGTMYFEG